MAASQTATASGSCTPPRQAGRPSPATESSRPWQASSSGRATKAGPGPALSPGSEPSRRPSLLGLLGGVLVLALLAGQWWFLVHLLRQNGRLLVRLEAVEASLQQAVAS